MHPIQDRVPAVYVTPELTKLVELHSHSGARIEGRKVGEGSCSIAQRSRDPALAIPDFATLHAEAPSNGAGTAAAAH